ARTGRGVTRTVAKVADGARTEAQRRKDPTGGQPGGVQLPGLRRALATLTAAWPLVWPCAARSQKRATPARCRAANPQPLDAAPTHHRGRGGVEHPPPRLVWIFPLPAQHPSDMGPARLGPGEVQGLVVAQARM